MAQYDPIQNAEELRQHMAVLRQYARAPSPALAPLAEQALDDLSTCLEMLIAGQQIQAGEVKHERTHRRPVEPWPRPEEPSAQPVPALLIEDLHLVQLHLSALAGKLQDEHDQVRLAGAQTRIERVVELLRLFV